MGYESGTKKFVYLEKDTHHKLKLLAFHNGMSLMRYVDKVLTEHILVEDAKQNKN